MGSWLYQIFKPNTKRILQSLKRTDIQMACLCSLFTSVCSHECVQLGLFVTSLFLFFYTAGVLGITLIDIYVPQRNIHTHRTPEAKEKKETNYS